jgi:CheY-like chemotaxis protein
MKTLRKRPVTPPKGFLAGKELALIEDDPAQQQIIRSLLNGSGAGVRSYLTAEGAWRELRDQPVDLVIADIMMPGMDGWDLHSRLRMEGVNQQTPFLFTTSLISKRQEALMSDLPARTLSLAKPLSREVLWSALHRLNAAGGRDEAVEV